MATRRGRKHSVVTQTMLNSGKMRDVLTATRCLAPENLRTASFFCLSLLPNTVKHSSEKNIHDPCLF